MTVNCRQTYAQGGGLRIRGIGLYLLIGGWNTEKPKHLEMELLTDHQMSVLEDPL